MGRCYPKPLKPEEIYEGRNVCLFMTFKGAERAKRGGSFDDWCIDAAVEEVKDGIVTVSITSDVQKELDLTVDKFFFYTDKKFREVGKAEPDFRLFRNKGEANDYEYYRDMRRTYHVNNREKDNARNKRWAEENNEMRKEYERNRRIEFRDEIFAQAHKSYETHKEGKRQYYLDNKGKIDAFQKQYKQDHKDILSEQGKIYNQRNKERIYAQKREYVKAHREELNAKKRDRYAADIENNREKKRMYREAHKEHINEQNRKRYAEHIEEERERSRAYYWANREKESERKKLERQRKKQTVGNSEG